ncbi:right-handed parallel beta-helix repeat-containing protein [Halostella salina]|uniref:right-handed parallel beta-helix repeat-containing protein n=1 Tax=Halostella salina TaxID=1547897 RepID=UPI000EF7A2B3|nr:right-handed parallel beta-helix repeat-containing protein [Halostella salina]
MTRTPTRRRVLGAGATIGVGAIAGCADQSNDSTDTDESDETPTEPDTATETTAEEPAVADGGGVLPARYVVTKADGEIRSYNGDTLAVEFSGTAGEEDWRVLQETLDAVDGGRIFVRRAEYTPDRRLTVESSHTTVYSDFARFTFQDHPTDDDGGAQVDFLVDGAGSPLQHVEVNGLVLDANKANRTTPTRTADIWGESSHVTYRNCVIFGGKSVDGDGGYGIGEDDDADYVTIDNCVIRDSDRHAYHPSAANHRIVNSTFIDNAQRTGDVFDLSATNAVVANNHFENNGHGVKIDDSGSRPNEGHITITGNVFVDNYLPDIASGQVELVDSTVRSVSITDNTFVLPEIDAEETSAHLLVDTDGSIGSVHVRNNHFEGGGRNALTSFTETGRHIGTFVVEHNTFEGIPREIGLLASAERLLVRDNLFECTGTGDGRLEVKECSTGVVSGNVLYDASISVADGVDAVVDRNHSFSQ